MNNLQQGRNNLLPKPALDPTQRAPRGWGVELGAAGLTSQDVSLVHEVCAEHSDTVGFPVPQQVPDDVARAGIHPRRGLVQQQDLGAKPPRAFRATTSAFPPQHTQEGLVEACQLFL